MGAWDEEGGGVRACPPPRPSRPLHLARLLEPNRAKVPDKYPSQLLMASLLERTLGGIRKDQDAGDNRRTSGGGQSRNSPYAVSRAPRGFGQGLLAP